MVAGVTRYCASLRHKWRLTIVADPDGLLLEEGILEGIRQRGFDLIPFDDHIAFRYAYESKFRSRWDRGEQTDLVVVLRSSDSDLSALPFDLLQAGRRLSFNLGDIFPHLSYPVVAALDRSDGCPVRRRKTMRTGNSVITPRRSLPFGMSSRSHRS